MTKSDLINLLALKFPNVPLKDVDQATKHLIDHMSDALMSGDRIEIRGFGSFSLRFRPPRVGRNPKTGDTVELESKHVPHFKPGKELRDMVNDSKGKTPLKKS